MAHWLMKSEPVKYGWDDLVRDRRTHWDGVRNNQAALYLKAMAVGDTALLYHSNEGLAAVGIMKIVRTAYPDPSDEKGRFVMVDVAPVKPLKRHVPLAEMKAEPRLAGMAMFRQFRLSIAPLTDEEWSVMMELAKTRG